jgi:xylulokinase
VPPSADGRPGELRGIRGATDAEDVARATLEGVVCTLLAAIDSLRDADVPVGGQLYLVGHGARMHALAQVLADVGERIVSVPKGDRAASGACVQAAAALQGVPPDDVARAWGMHDARPVEPDARVDGGEIRAAHRDAVHTS